MILYNQQQVHAICTQDKGNGRLPSIERVIMMADKKIIGIRNNQAYLQKAVDCFTAWWKFDRRIYDDCISNSIKTTSPLPRWYLMLKNEDIIGGYGLITNDFISRQDLLPWLCALYIEEECRGNQLGSKLLEHAKSEALQLGYKKLYLSTDLEGYYESHGWKSVAKGYHPWGAESMIYEIDTKTGETSDCLPLSF
jgi:GNAT superfamily N-acetyltransferase